MSLNLQIKKLREITLDNMSQVNFALGLDVHRRTVQGWEYGKYEPLGASRKYLEHLMVCKLARDDFKKNVQAALKYGVHSPEKQPTPIPPPS